MFSDKKMYPFDYKAICGFLEHLNNKELEDVLNYDNKFEDMVKDINLSKDIETDKEMLLASNRSLAEFNLKREPEIQSMKEELHQLSRVGESLYTSIEEKSVKLKNQAKNNNLDTALALLQTAAAEMEEESEGVAELFLEGTTDIEGFLEPFTSRRKIMHLRRVKSDKMAEMIRRRNSTVHYPSTENYTSLYQPPPPIAAVPYPLGPISSMPIPSSYSMHNQF
ncbi:hypothetical protein AAG570_012973 [Ranatra chinensis]|uniref:VPS37 C-terminal domain-containing protein n=1 Tax=Ranatra chinensis TaxID=642074 RepID=A0ABD0YFK2_9HEMI